MSLRRAGLDYPGFISPMGMGGDSGPKEKALELNFIANS